jgi:isopentenyl-diphosphate delta-isomerase
MTAEITIPAIAADGSLFAIEKMKAHQLGQQHLAISVFVFSGTRLLIQQRAEGKYHCPGKWANTCCSHPHWGESVEAAAARRIAEELGVSVPLAKTTVLDYRADVGGGLIENERVHVFIADTGETQLKCTLDPREVSAVKWVDVSALPGMLENQSDTLCPWFAIYIDRWNELKLGRC